MMLIVSRVCAEFHDQHGNPVFRITPAMLGGFIQMPEEVKEDLLFHQLVRDGSITYARTDADRIRLENDPMANTNADGSEIRDTVTEPRPKSAKSAKAKESKVEEPMAGSAASASGDAGVK